MSKISTYSLADSPLQLSDRLIGTEAPRPIPSPIPLATKNFSLGELLQLFSSNFPAATLQAVLNAGNIATQDITLTGTINVTLIKPTNIEDMLGSQGTPFQVLSKAIGGFNWVDPPGSITLTTTGSSGPSTLVSGVLNIPVYAGGVTPNLQQVTDEGNTTTKSIIIDNDNILTAKSFIVNNTTSGGYTQLSSDFMLIVSPSGTTSAFANGALTLGDLNQDITNLVNLSVINDTTNYGVGFLLNSSASLQDISLIYHPDYFIPQAPGNSPSIFYIPYKLEGTYTLATLDDIPSYTTPTLQQVTDEGNTTTNDIIVRNPDDALKQVVIHRPDAGDDTSSVFAQYDADTYVIAYAQDGASAIAGSVYDPAGNGEFTLSNGLLSTSNSACSMLFQGGNLDLSSLVDQPYIGMSGVGNSVSINTNLLTGNRLQELPDKDGTFAMLDDIPAAGVTSVGLTMPSAFTVTNSPITSSGDIAVTGVGLVSQYIRGDGTLANFPNSTGGGSSVNYYLNGSVSQGTFGGDTYYQMSKTPILGAGTNFTRTNGAGNGYIASFITDVADPSQLNIPGGNWNVEFYFNASSGGGSPSFYAELYKVSATNVFTLIASDSANPEGITNGTTVDQYFTSIPVPQTTLLATDRLAIRIFVNTGGRTITLHTENGNLSEVLTTFTTGLTALNGLTAQVQNLAVGTTGTDFAINSTTSTHTFNLPTASAANRGALSSADWTTFNNKQNNLKTFNRTQGVYYFEEFMGSQAGSVSTSYSNVISLTTGNATARTASTTNRTNQQGIIQHSTGTASTNSAGYALGSSSLYIGTGTISLETYMSVETLSTSLERFFTFFGYGIPSNWQNSGNTIFFSYDEGGVVYFAGTPTPNWKCYTRAGATVTLTTTTVPVVAAQWYKLRIDINSAASSITFYIDGTLVATHSTNIPSTASAMSVVSLIVKTAGTTARSLLTDYFMYEEIFTNPR
jgi:hypothetical protein